MDDYERGYTDGMLAILEELKESYLQANQNTQLTALKDVLALYGIDFRDIQQQRHHFENRKCTALKAIIEHPYGALTYLEFPRGVGLATVNQLCKMGFIIKSGDKYRLTDTGFQEAQR